MCKRSLLVVFLVFVLLLSFGFAENITVHQAKKVPVGQVKKQRIDKEKLEAEMQANMKKEEAVEPVETIDPKEEKAQAIFQKMENNIQLTASEKEFIVQFLPSFTTTPRKNPFEASKDAVLDEGFEGTFPPTDWTVTDDEYGDGWSQDNGSTHGPNSVAEGSFAAMADIYNMYYTSANLTSPSLDLTTLTTPQLRFWWQCKTGYGDDPNLTVKISIDGGTNWSELYNQDADGVADSWIEVVLDLSTYSSETSVIVDFIATSDYGSYNLFVDKVTVDSAPTEPIMVLSTYSIDFGNVGAEVGKETVSEKVYVSNNGGGTLNITDFTLSSTDISVDSTSLTVEPGIIDSFIVTLAPTTTGVFTGKVTIASNDAVSTDTIAVTATVIPAGYVVESFEDDFPPQSWARVGYTSSYLDGWYENTSSSYVYDGSKSAKAKGQNSWLFTPKLTISTGDFITFYYRSESSSYPAGLKLRISTGSDQMDTTGYTTVLWEDNNVDETEYQKVTYTFDATYNGQDVYLAFQRDWAYANNWYTFVDYVTHPPVWVNPNPVMELSTTEVEFNTIAVGDTDSVEVEIYNIGGSDLIINNVFATGDFEYSFASNFKGLLTVSPGDTGYLEIYFIPTEPGHIGGGIVLHTNDTESWPIISVSGTAIPEGYTVEGFETDLFPPLGWKQIDIFGNGWKQYGYSYPHTGDWCAKAPWTSSGGESWLITPKLNLGYDDFINFWLDGSSSAGTDLYVWLSSTGTDTADFDVLLGTWIAGENMPVDYEYIELNLPSYKGDVYVAFQLVDDNGYSFYIDDVTLPPYELSGPQVSLSPPELYFGMALVNDETVDRKFVVTNVGGLDLDVTSMTSSHADFTVDFGVNSLAPGESDTFTVTFAPTIEGDYEEYIAIVSNSETVNDTLWLFGTGYVPISYYEEDFNTTFTCDVIDANEDGNTWGWYYFTSDPTNAFAGIPWASPANDDYLITPKLHINTGDNLEFDTWCYSNYYPEIYEVYVQTSKDLSTWTTPVLVDTIDWIEPAQFTIDLSVYANTDVYIGFRNISPDCYYQFIDNIYVGPTITPIYDIQFVADPAVNDTSTMYGQTVNVKGIVTWDEYESTTQVVIQDAEAPWSGIAAYLATKDVITVNRGDELMVTGLVDENFNNCTVLEYSEIEVLSTGNDINPIEVGLAELSSIATDEQYECVLVKVNLVEVAEVSGDDWLVTDGVDTVAVGTMFEAIVNYVPEIGDVIDVAGLWFYSTINVRDDDDIYKYLIGGVEGTVTEADVKGDSLAGVTVSVAGQSTVTDADGYYLIGGIPEGDYNVRAELTGYLPVSTPVTIGGDTIIVNLELEEYSFEADPPVALIADPHDQAVQLFWSPPGTGGDFTEGFEGVTEIPDGWGNIDNDGGGTAWFIYAYSPHTGLSSAGSIYNSDASANDDWLITPILMNPTVDAAFTFWAAPQDPDYSVESFNVYVSTTGPNIADFGTDPDTSYTFAAGDTVWKEFPIDMTPYLSATQLWVAIQCVSVDQFVLKIDDVVASGFAGGDVKLTTGLKQNDLPMTFVRGAKRETAEIFVTDGSRHTKGDKEIENAEWWTDEMFMPGTQMTLNFYVTNASSDVEWIIEATLDFPTGVNVITATDLGDLDYDGSTGDGAFVTWSNGNIYSTETAVTSITLEFDASLTEDLEIPWTLSGDEWGDPPHEVSGVLLLTTFHAGDFIGYNVYFSGEKGDPINEFPILETNYLVKDLEDETEYCFEATAIYYPGVESEPSNQACATTIYEFGDVTGVVYDPNDNLIEGAVVSCMGLTDVTGTDGVYLLENLLPGINTIKAVAEGFDYMCQDVEIIAQGTPVTADFHMIPKLDKPYGLDALEGDGLVDLNWNSPSGGIDYVISYCDDTAENATGWYDSGNMNAIRFTPLGYPVTVLGGELNVYDGTWPAGDLLQPFQMKVFDDDGPDGFPGTELGTVSIVPVGYNWIQFEFAGITITDGDFYIAHVQGGNYPDCLPTAIDDSNPVYRSYSRYVTGGEDWEVASYADFMIRAFVNGPEGGKFICAGGSVVEIDNINVEHSVSIRPTSLLVGEYEQGNGAMDDVVFYTKEDSLLGYNVYRMDAIIDTLLSTTTDTIYTDLSPVNYVEYAYYIKAIWKTDLYDTLESKPSNLASATPWKLGDPNFDNDVNVADIVLLVNFILTTDDPTTEQFRAADVNFDGDLNILDVIKLIEMTFDRSMAKGVNDPGMTADLILPDIAPIHEKTGEVDMGIDFEGTAYGLQFTVRYNPDLMTIENPVINANGKLSIVTNQVEKGEMIVLAYSMSGEKINFNVEILFTIPVEFVNKNYRGKASIEIDDVILAGPSGAEILMDKNSGSVTLAVVPVKYALHQNYPNPFNPTTTINYDLPKNAHVEIVIYNILGQNIRTLVNDDKPFGYHSVVWDGMTDSGESVSSGLYIYRIISGDFHKVKKMVLLK